MPRGRTSSRSWRFSSREGLLGGFHFNDRKYADDDLIVGAIDPFALFRIMVEIAAAGRDPATAETVRRLAFMIDQSHNVEGKMLVRVGFMLPSSAERSRNSLLVAHWISSHAASLCGERAFMTIDHVHRFGATMPVGPAGGRA